MKSSGAASEARADFVVVYYASHYKNGTAQKHFLCGDDAEEAAQLREAILSELDPAAS